MKVTSEVFKGIEFIRISNLPEDQQQIITSSIERDKIIKILKEKIIMKDCVQYHDYIAWYTKYLSQQEAPQEKYASTNKLSAFKLAFK